MFMPPMSGGEHQLDVLVETEFEDVPSDGANPRMIMFMDPKLWTLLILKKDLNSEPLRWFLLRKQFEFEVCDKS